MMNNNAQDRAAEALQQAQAAQHQEQQTLQQQQVEAEPASAETPEKLQEQSDQETREATPEEEQEFERMQQQRQEMLRQQRLHQQRLQQQQQQQLFENQHQKQQQQQQKAYQQQRLQGEASPQRQGLSRVHWKQDVVDKLRLPGPTLTRDQFLRAFVDATSGTTHQLCSSVFEQLKSCGLGGEVDTIAMPTLLQLLQQFHEDEIKSVLELTQRLSAEVKGEAKTDK
ncbi:hypothetical protein ACSSS7_007300 [Eimeria intestinalis]